MIHAADILLNPTMAVTNGSLNDKWRAFKCNSICKSLPEKEHCPSKCSRQGTSYQHQNSYLAVWFGVQFFHHIAKHCKNTITDGCSTAMHSKAISIILLVPKSYAAHPILVHTTLPMDGMHAHKSFSLSRMSRSSEQLKASNWDNLLTLASPNLVIFFYIETNCVYAIIRCLKYRGASAVLKIRFES